MKKYSSAETATINEILTELLKDKTVKVVTRVNCDEGATIHFSDGTKIEFGYSGCEGETAVNDSEVDVRGV